jgi:hypothetical protein
MECREVRRMLSAYAEGLVSAAEKVSLDDHLEACPACKAFLSDLRKTIEYVQEIPEAEPPAWLTQKVMARVRAEAEKEAEARKSLWERLFRRTPAWRMQEATPTVCAEPEAARMKKTPTKGIWERLFYPIHVKLPLEAAGVIAIAVVTVYVYKGIQSEIQVGKPPLEGMRAPAISEVQKPAAPPSLSQERQQTTLNKPIETKPSMAARQQTLQKKREFAPPLLAPSPAPSPAPTEMQTQAGPTAGTGMGVKGGAQRDVPSGEESGRLAFDAAKEKDQSSPGVGFARPETEMERSPGKPLMQGGERAQEEKERRAAPLSSMEAKKDESKLESPPATPREDYTIAKRIEERAARPALPAAPRAKALADKKEPGLRLTLTVRDPDAARLDIERALAELGGRVIRMEPTEEGFRLVVELIANQVPALQNRLRSFGAVKETAAESDVSEGGTENIRLEIFVGR